MNSLEKTFEAFLWNSRLIIAIIVVFSLVLVVGILLVTTLDVVTLAGDMLSYLNPSLTVELRDKMRIDFIIRVVGVIDGYLIGAILFIFSLGIYELFINKIERAEGSEVASRLLLIRSLDDLKDRLANMILLIIIVKYFQQALNIKYATPMDLMYLSVGVALVGAGLYLSARAKNGKSDKAEKSEDSAKA